MDKYIRVTDLNEVYELKKNGGCFKIVDYYGGFPTSHRRISSNGLTDNFSADYYKLNPEYDEWIELDPSEWRFWMHKLIGVPCQVRDNKEREWEDGILKWINGPGLVYKFWIDDGSSYRYCRVKKSLLEA